MKARTLENLCKRKKRFSKANAIRVIKRVASRDHKKLYKYKCAYCTSWHLTSSSKEEYYEQKQFYRKLRREFQQGELNEN